MEENKKTNGSNNDYLLKLDERYKTEKKGIIKGGVFIFSPPGIEANKKNYELIDAAAEHDLPVLIEGESGTGKELFARAIHYESCKRGRKGGLVAVNCGAIPEHLVESTLFGHEKGAYTGAYKRQIGKIGEAHGGTLFLDEIAEMPFDSQVKLLRVLQDKKVTMVGGSECTDVDFRLICAANQDVYQLVTEGRFRDDLYFRTKGFNIKLSPLREWGEEDKISVFEYFLLKYIHEVRGEEQEEPPKLAYGARFIIKNYNWPGNIRELETAAKRAVVLSTGEEILGEDLGVNFKLSYEIGDKKIDLEGLSLKKAKEVFEKELIIQTLTKTKGRVAKAARILKIARQNLHEKIKRYKINPREYF